MTCRIILTHARSGSSALSRAIREASGAPLMMEPFGRAMRRRGVDPELDTFGPYAREVAERHEIIKHLWHVFTRAQNRDLLADPLYGEVVFLHRENVVAASVSQLVAAQTREWDKNEGTKPLREIPLATLRSAVDTLREEIAYYRQLADDSGRLVLSVSYEEIYASHLGLDDKKAILSRVCDALRVSASDDALREAAEKHLTPAARYNGPDRYAMIPNIAELREEFGDGILAEV